MHFQRRHPAKSQKKQYFHVFTSKSPLTDVLNYWRFCLANVIFSLGKILKCLLLTLLVLIVVLVHIPTAIAQSTLERTPLTLEILQERVGTPILLEGNMTVDLRQMVIDLRPENGDFRDSFYQLLRNCLQKAGGKPLSLDLSYSQIQGDFIGSDLGLRTPFYSQGIVPIYTPVEQQQLERLRIVCLESLAAGLLSSKDCKSLLNTESNISTEISVFRGMLTMQQTRFSGNVQFNNTFFLQKINSQGAIFNQLSNWNETRFSREVNFNNTNFRKETQFKGSIFFDKADFKQSQFLESAYFQDSTFENKINFAQVNFKQLVKFNRARWQDNADFSQVRFFEQAQFTKADFNKFLFLTEATFEQSVTFREAQFNQPVNLRGASILNQADFSDAEFAPEAYLNVAGLAFNSNQAKILGNSGEIGKKICVPTLQGNQNVLRNLIQNFRQLQQIGDANQIDYTKQRLRLSVLTRRLFDTNINTASQQRLINLGFTETQAKAVIKQRELQPFRNQSQLFSLPEIDYDTYNQLASRIIFKPRLSVISWVLKIWGWFALSLLLLLSDYGTNFWLIFGVGTITIAIFGLIYWLIDRYRRLIPTPIIPTLNETLWMSGTFFTLLLFGLLSIFRSSEQPWLTLSCLAIIVIPIPVILLFKLYQTGRHHDLMDISYFTEEGTLRQLRLLIGRLPVIPRFELFKERYMPLRWNSRWNWLNYYDFSLNNLLRFGFNDIRLRDQHIPGILTIITWYQWILGVIYITLLFWTLSRTIPGLNLLIYLK
jgi:uncharacterized membrane protein